VDLSDAVEALIHFVDHFALSLALLPVVVPALVLAHELGHALACAALRHPVRELRVGDTTPLFSLRARDFRLHLGAVTGTRRVGGYVRYDGTRASARDILIIALAGPAASIVAALAAGAAFVAAPSHPTVLLLMLVGGLLDGVGNLHSSGDEREVWSDGKVARFAWRALRHPAPPPAWTDPREATSVAPPGY
jgi:membrane-associated protease RseP (regulator of RpoE activity)